jgi:cytochrome c peroxidase
LTRNAPGLFNLHFQRRLFWDLRVLGLENQVLQPIGHPDEMGMDLGVLPSKLEETSYYPALFEDAFGDEEVNLDRIMDALVQFLMSIRTYQSRYDEGLTNGFAGFTESELLGKDVFFNGVTRCNQCHSGLNFFSTQPFINGLEVDYAAAGDGGIGELTGNADDDGRFKTISLRNVGLTAPYMHDGRFADLRAVVDFYSDSIQPHPYLDERFSDNGIGPPGQEPYRLDLSEAEREGLVAFLHTLTDTTLLSNPALASPF